MRVSGRGNEARGVGCVRAAATVIVAVGAMSCAPADGDGEGMLGVSESPLFFEPGVTLWNGGSTTNQGAVGGSALIAACFAVRPRLATNGVVNCPNQSSQNIDCEGRSTNPFNSQVLSHAILRPMIQSTIERTWFHAADIEIVNWGDCPIDASINMHRDSQLAQMIVIQFQQEFDPPPNAPCTTDANCSATPHAFCNTSVNPPVCAAGGVDFTTVLGRSTSGPTVIQYNWPAMQPGNDQFNLIHEFGHAFGFSHEWRRSDFPDPSCTASDVRSVPNGSRSLRSRTSPRS